MSNKLNPDQAEVLSGLIWVQTVFKGYQKMTLGGNELTRCLENQFIQQVAQWATIAHHGASIMFGDTIIYDAQRQITLNLKQ